MSYFKFVVVCIISFVMVGFGGYDSPHNKGTYDMFFVNQGMISGLIYMAIALICKFLLPKEKLKIKSDKRYTFVILGFSVLVGLLYLLIVYIVLMSTGTMPEFPRK